MVSSLKNSIFSIKSEQEFNDIALKIFRFQYDNNPVYRKFTQYLRMDIKDVGHFREIPFLPVEFFKKQRVFCGNEKAELVFRSSRTTGQEASVHYVKDAGMYKQALLESFSRLYGPPGKYRILALLPAYMERKDASLIYMVNELMTQTGFHGNHFIQSDFTRLKELLKDDSVGRKTLLIGVTFALLDFAETSPFRMPKDLIVMETGGMKGRREEIIREDFHQRLQFAFGIKTVHSEYGMTELLSQAYSREKGLYRCPPWMRVLIRDTNDPLHFRDKLKTGGINIIDLANLHSCSFLATQDLGKVYPDNSFEVLGRYDNSDVRGCNLLVE